MENILSLNFPTFNRRVPSRAASAGFWLLSLLLFLSLIVFYIFQINSQVHEGYLLSDSQKKLNALQQEKEMLQANLAGVASLGQAETLAASLNFKQVNQIHYIEVLETSVAAAGN